LERRDFLAAVPEGCLHHEAHHLDAAMPNLLNVAELTRMLEAAPQDSDHVHSRAELQAHFLAARGVIVPTVLTDDEAVKIGADAVGRIPTDPAEIALCVREGLQRIARGNG
jgi:hypothetical protein